MADEFEGDLTDAVFWGADLTGATFRDVNLSNITVSHAWLIDANIDALIERLTINGVDVTDYVNQHDRWYPLRGMLRPSDPAGMRATWALMDQEWSAAIDRARRLTDEQVNRSVDGEFSFVSTIRHLVFGVDKWFVLPLLGDATFEPIGLPNTGSLGYEFPGLQLDSTPTLDQALDVRAAQMSRFAAYLDGLTSDDFDREVQVFENGGERLIDCIYTVFEEGFHHLRYALRDLDRLSA